MNNKENYKKAIDKIQVNTDIKNRTIENIKQRKMQNKYNYMKLLTSCAMFMLIFAIGYIFFYENTIQNNTVNNQLAVSNQDLNRFENIKELKEVLEEKNISYNENDMYILEESAIDSSTIIQDTMSTKGDITDNYSTTNVQVENVDEADIVKTDGNYIYYVANDLIYIIQTDTMAKLSIIDLNKNNETFNPIEIYIKEDKLVVLGNAYTYTTSFTATNELYLSDVNDTNMTKAIIFDISNKFSPIEERAVALEGNYISSRMIENNLYFIASKTPRYYDGILDHEILPLVKDSNSEDRYILATDIAYFENTDSYSIMTVGGFDINSLEEVSTESFFGASNTVYCSENNLYITQIVYEDTYYFENGNYKNIVYKFNLNNAQINLEAQGEVNGYLNDQFSMDEYNGFLRIATTDGNAGLSSNGIYILNENLEEISRVSGLAIGEKIYSVRFMGNIGYVVTFEEIDPLFVIDLSDPYNPKVKGELKIPGYSSYLHPYDETHIIGIGYNTEVNEYGGVINTNMKMSMFDVSDLENPKELYHIDIGEEYVYSEITSNHKALFYNTDRNLIGFPVTSRLYNTYDNEKSFILYNIDLENGFREYAKFYADENSYYNIDRGIYIGENFYTLEKNKITKYNLNTLEKLEELEL